MAKFETIWGELNVGSVTPAPEGEGKKPEDKKDLDKTVPNEELENEEEEEDIPKSKSEDVDPDKKGGTEEEEEDEDAPRTEFDDDDVSKAFEMLEDEGVLELTDDDEFENSTSGLADAVAATVRNKLKAEIDSIPPVVQEFYSHVISGNDPSSFTINTPIVWADVDSQDEEIQKTAVLQLMKSQNMSDEDAQEELADIIELGKLEKRAGIAIEALAKTQETQIQAEQKAEAKRAEEAKKGREKEIKVIEETIDSSDELAGFKMDDKRRKAFKDYLFKVNPRSGKTQMQMNMADEDRRLKVAFMDFIEFTKADVEKEVATQLTKSRKKKLSRYSDRNVKSKNSSQSVVTKENKNKGKIKFPTIFGSSSIEVED